MKISCDFRSMTQYKFCAPTQKEERRELLIDLVIVILLCSYGG